MLKRCSIAAAAIVMLAAGLLASNTLGSRDALAQRINWPQTLGAGIGLADGARSWAPTERAATIIRSATLRKIQASTGTILVGDTWGTVVVSNATAAAITLPQASADFMPANSCFDLVNVGAGTATVTPTTSKLNVIRSSAAVTRDHSIRFCSDGTDYFAGPGGATFN